MNNCLYDSTVSNSMDESLAKAVAIYHRELSLQKQRHVLSLVRPDVSLSKGLYAVLLIVVVSLMVGLGAIKLSVMLGIPWWPLVSGFAGLLLTVICLKSKSILNWSILVYQKYAPAELRLSCRFEPCCSEYMKIAINKYGVLRGLCKGIGRLSRCHHPNGGVDNPY